MPVPGLTKRMLLSLLRRNTPFPDTLSPPRTIRAHSGPRLPIFPDPEDIIREKEDTFHPNSEFSRRTGEVIFSHVTAGDRLLGRVRAVEGGDFRPDERYEHFREEGWILRRPTGRRVNHSSPPRPPYGSLGFI